VLDAVRQQIGGWPAQASLLVAGQFQSSEGELRTFHVFFRGEVRVEPAFDEPLVLAEDGEATVTVEVQPARWFKQDGTLDFEGRSRAGRSSEP
jgi:hypothetical protein